MRDPTDLAHLVGQWVVRADEDLAAAVHLLTVPGAALAATICFHAQQSAEKHLKALLLWRSIPFPRTHDIGELVALLPASITVPLTATEQETLTDHATHTRYPGDWDPVGPSEAMAALALAQRLRDAVSVHLPHPPASLPSLPPPSP